MLKSKGKVWKATSHSRGHVIYIPADITIDSAYPFKPKDVVNIEVDTKENRIIITRDEQNE